MLASGDNYPDALAGAPLAGQLKAPILLLGQTPDTSTSVLNYIKDHVNKAGKVYILGGTGVVPAAFVSSLVNIGFTADQIHRLGGNDRNETSLLIAKELENKSLNVVLVSDANFYDALTVASATVTEGVPILLVSAQGLTAAQKEFCDNMAGVLCFGELGLKVSSIYPEAVSLSGKNRYESNAIWALASGSQSTLFLATGEDFPDALAGAVLAGFYESPIILTTPETLQSETFVALSLFSFDSKQPGQDPITGQTVPAINYPELIVFGGAGAVSENAVMQAQQILNGPGYPIGNTRGNILNGGLAAVWGEWIYYTDDQENGDLYKIKLDGTQKTKLSQDTPSYINVSEDWVYYSNNMDGKLYKIKTDGSQRTKLSDDTCRMTTLSGDWIYYVNASDSNSIWKVSTDGKQIIKLSGDYAWSLNVVGDTIYYVNADENNRIYKMNDDGSGKSRINDSVSASMMLVFDDTIFYADYSSSSSFNIYKMKTDGTGNMKIVDDLCINFNFDGEWIYYTNGKDNYSLYKIRPDGTGKLKFNNNHSTSINLVSDWVYYDKDFPNQTIIYRIRTDGSGEQLAD